METTIATNFISEDFDIQNFDTIKPYFDDLNNRIITSKESLEEWLRDRNRLESKIMEEQGWIYIKLQTSINDKEQKGKYEHYFSEIMPKIAPHHDALNNKLVDCAYLQELDQDKYFIYLRKIKSQVELFEEKNIELFSKTNISSSKYGNIAGAMSIEMEGKEITMQKAVSYLEYVDRAVRQEAYEKTTNKRKENMQELDDLFDELLTIRHQIALNAGFDNFREFTFKRLGRFDYTPEDCLEFHNSIKEVAIPLIDKIYSKRKEVLGYESLKPWDMNVDPSNKAPLKPFETTDELISKSITVLNRVDTSFGAFLSEMNDKGFLDLDSRKNKAPGGFLYPLPVSNVPFIFMNATGTLRDVTTMVHEGGHAIHSYLSTGLELDAFKDVPAEVAEYASMAMELLTMEHWDVYFENEDDLRRAKSNHLEKIITFYPWMALIDHFQHWIYLNPDHNQQQRKVKWLELLAEFSSTQIDYTGHEAVRSFKWQSQLHIYEVPFYYIEYAMAQLGAIATWKQYKNDPKKALQNYKRALSLGYTKPINEIYQAAEVEFNFSKPYVNELLSFVYDEYLKLQ